MPRQFCDLLGLATWPLRRTAEGISYFRLLRLKSYSLKENGGILRCLFFHLLIENSAEHFKKLKIERNSNCFPLSKLKIIFSHYRGLK